MSITADTLLETMTQHAAVNGSRDYPAGETLYGENALAERRRVIGRVAKELRKHAKSEGDSWMGSELKRLAKELEAVR